MQDISEATVPTSKPPSSTNKEPKEDSKPKSSKKAKFNHEPLDPMDPASYSDIPR